MEGQPFFFDQNIFDDEDLSKLTEAEKEKLPEFTRDQLHQAVQKARAEGKTDGIKEAQGNIEKQALNTLEKIQRDMAVLFAAEDDRTTKYEMDSVLLALELLKKLYPHYAEKQGEAELENALKIALNTHKTPEKITIEMNPDISKHITDYINQLGNELGKILALKLNPNFSAEQCQITWPYGGITVNRNKIIEKTFAMVTESLAENGINVHDNEDNKSHTPASDSKADKNTTDSAGEPS